METDKPTTAEGKVIGLEMKSQNYALIVEAPNGKQYKIWAKQPAVYKDKTEIKVGDRAIYDYYKQTTDGGAFFFKMSGLPEKVHLTTNIPERKLEEFAQADTVTETDKIVSTGASVMGKCYDAVTQILGRKPEKEGEPAYVNSLFIWATKEMYFNGKGERR